jgi:pimeloyl-ACP methyl ester carboxylesterase
MPYANNNGIRIHFETAGDGPPLVLLHPYPGWPEGWIDTGYIDALKDAYRLVLIDVRGFGNSDKPHDPEAYGLQDRAADVVAVLDDLGLNQAHMWGYSMGGRIVWGLARFFSERCRSLIIGGDYPYEPDPAGPLPPWVQAQLEWLGHGQDSYVNTMMAIFDPWIRPEWEWPAGFACSDLAALTAFLSHRERVGLVETLPGLAVPCLLYAGDQDPAHALLRGWASQVGNASYVTMPGVNHPQGFSERDLILPHVRAFLAGVEQDRRAG